MELQELFQQAIANSKTLSEKPDNETLLKLYSLFKKNYEINLERTLYINKCR